LAEDILAHAEHERLWDKMEHKYSLDIVDLNSAFERLMRIGRIAPSYKEGIANLKDHLRADIHAAGYDKLTARTFWIDYADRLKTHSGKPEIDYFLRLLFMHDTSLRPEVNKMAEKVHPQRQIAVNEAKQDMQAIDQLNAAMASSAGTVITALLDKNGVEFKKDQRAVFNGMEGQVEGIVGDEGTGLGPGVRIEFDHQPGELVTLRGPSIRKIEVLKDHVDFRAANFGAHLKVISRDVNDVYMLEFDGQRLRHINAGIYEGRGFILYADQTRINHTYTGHLARLDALGITSPYIHSGPLWGGDAYFIYPLTGERIFNDAAPHLSDADYETVNKNLLKMLQMCLDHGFYFSRFNPKDFSVNTKTLALHLLNPDEINPSDYSGRELAKQWLAFHVRHGYWDNWPRGHGIEVPILYFTDEILAGASIERVPRGQEFTDEQIQKALSFDDIGDTRKFLEEVAGLFPFYIEPAGHDLWKRTGPLSASKQILSLRRMTTWGDNGLGDGAMDAAMARKGGIDLNAAHLDMRIKRDGHGVSLLPGQDMAQLANIQGLEPEILAIKPAVDVPAVKAMLTNT
jgi:hypothetical protein